LGLNRLRHAVTILRILPPKSELIFLLSFAVIPELLKGLLEKVSADGLQVVAEQIAQPEPLLLVYRSAPPKWSYRGYYWIVAGAQAPEDTSWYLHLAAFFQFGWGTRFPPASEDCDRRLSTPLRVVIKGTGL
jgi:hypothetical protein